VAHALELATRPPDDIGIDPFQGWTLRLVEVAVVGDPAADARVVHLGQFGQGFVTAVMQRLAADFAADARQSVQAGGGLEAVREDASVRLHPHYLSSSKLEAEKVKVDVGEVAARAPRKASGTIIQPVRVNRGPSRKCGAYPNFRGISLGQDMVRSSNSSRKLPGNFRVSQSLDSAIAFVVTKLGRYPRRPRQWASSMQLPADSQRVARAPAAEVCA
jgi:hypothetical protein